MLRVSENTNCDKVNVATAVHEKITATQYIDTLDILECGYLNSVQMKELIFHASMNSFLCQYMGFQYLIHHNSS